MEFVGPTHFFGACGRVSSVVPQICLALHFGFLSWLRPLSRRSTVPRLRLQWVVEALAALGSLMRNEGGFPAHYVGRFFFLYIGVFFRVFSAVCVRAFSFLCPCRGFILPGSIMSLRFTLGPRPLESTPGRRRGRGGRASLASRCGFS